MKKVLVYLFVMLTMQFCFAQNPTSKEYQNALRYGARAKITVKVVDENNCPVTNAEVSTFFRLSSGRSIGKDIKQITNHEGLVQAEARTTDRIFIQVNKDGYYPSWAQYKAQSRDPKRLKDGRWLPWNPTINLILKQIMNPVYMDFQFSDVKIPQYDQPMGFDILKHDWVMPFGKGVVSDMVIHFKPVKESHPYQLVAEFPGKFNGVYLGTKDSFSLLKSTHQVNTNMYFLKDLENRNQQRGPSHVLLRESDYCVFRIRSKIDSNGNLISAQYGKIYGPFDYCVMSRQFLRLTTFSNPNINDTSLEFVSNIIVEGAVYDR